MRVEMVSRWSRSRFRVTWHRSILPILASGEGEGGGVNPSSRVVLWFFDLCILITASKPPGPEGWWDYALGAEPHKDGARGAQP